MLHTVQLFLSIGLLVTAIFFSLLAASGLFGLYLRFIDRLPTGKADILTLLRNLRNALALYLAAYLAYLLPFPMLLPALVFLVIAWQLLRIRQLLASIRRNDAARGKRTLLSD